MRFYYTNAISYLGIQTDPVSSVGGLISGSPVPNSVLSNLFGEVSLLTLSENLKETKLLALKNELPAAVNNLKLYYVYPKNPVTKLMVAAVAPTIDTNCGNQSFEKIPNMRATPYYATFYDASAAYAEGNLIFTIPGVKNDTISIVTDDDTSSSNSVDNSIIATTLPLSQDNPTIENTIDAVVAALVNNATYEVTKVQDPYTLIFSVHFRRKIVGHNTTQFAIQTTGQAVASTIQLSGGFNNAVFLGTLAKDAFLGLWLQRSILPSARVPVTSDQLVKDYNAGVVLDTIEDIQLFLEWD